MNRHECNTRTHRLCGECKIVFPLTGEFFYKCPSDKSGFRHRCKKCGNRLRVEWTRKNRARHESNRIKWQYGLDAFAHAKLLEEQGGKCAVCGKLNNEGRRRLAVDHDHKTGKVRGLLCGNCNTALGLVKEDPEILSLLADYLRKRSGPIESSGQIRRSATDSADKE